jgi:transcriptional regulator with XRE-family HTH domain
MSKRWYIRYGLKEFLIHKNMSVEQVAQILDIDESVIPAWHQGLKEPDLAELTKFANHFKVDFCYDLDRKGFFFTERNSDEGTPDDRQSHGYIDNHHYAGETFNDRLINQMQESIEALRRSVSSLQKELIRVKLKVDSLSKPLDGDIELQNFFEQTY